ncbi:cytochrome c3 family protein [Trichloromonas sp.]|uniref:cytochrome c3 family protein n=1 Tax=Trichloromonas sp. TaxID=3069249 RepID=UPI003D81B938
MKSHVWRPLFVVIGIVVLILLARAFYVPDDFGTHERGYMYSYHRTGNIDEWKAYPVKYQGSEYCQSCHEEKAATMGASPHAMIPCENCHGAAFGHPEDPEKLAIDRGRDLCLRCHAALVTPGSGRSYIPGIDDRQHNADIECSVCHNPHNPNLAEM